MSRLDRLIEAERALVPRSRYVDKSKSWFMRFLNLFVRWFNPRFMTDFTTTIGAKSFFPPALLDPRVVDDQAVMVECHEFIHKWDFWQHELTFVVKYLFSRKFRRDAELRGYTMTMYWYWLRFGTQVDPETFVKHFTSSEYLYMERDPYYVRDELSARQQLFIQYEDQFLLQPGSEPYRLVKSFLKIEGILHA